MLFWRAKEILEGGSELFRAEAELVSKRLTRLLVGSALAVVVAMLGIVGLLLVTAGVLIELGQRVGWPEALAIVGGAYVFLCVMLYAITALRSGSQDAGAAQPSTLGNDSSAGAAGAAGGGAGGGKKPKAKAEDAKERLQNAASPDPDSAPDEEQDGLLDGLDALKDSAIEMGMKNPVALGSAALLVVSLLGPGKTIKMIGRGVAAAGLASSLLDAVSPSSESKSK